ISERTAATLARDTCAVPSNVYCVPSRATRARGWSACASRPAPGAASGMGDWSILVAVAFQQIIVGVDPPVAQKRPDAAHRFTARHIDIDDQQLGSFIGCLRQQFALRAGNKARSPELQAASAVGRCFKADAIARQQ